MGCMTSCLKPSETKPDPSIIARVDVVLDNLPKRTNESYKIQTHNVPFPNEIAIEKKEPTGAVKSEESEDDEYIEDIPKPKLQTKKGHSTVSAEAFGSWNKRANYVPKVVPKTNDQKARILQRLQKAFMFSNLEENERDIVIGAMEEKKFKAGVHVIRQGEQGNVLYIVDSGQLECFKKFQPNESQKLVKTYEPGESFGELALLYNVPRAATIISKTDSVLWQLDRDTFNAIVKDSAMKRREKYDQFLRSVPILSSMDDYERSKLSDCLKIQKFKNGDHIIHQGDKGSAFYIIQSGTAKATKNTPNSAEEKVFDYAPSDYFGELALLKDQLRAANIIATSDIEVVSIDRDSFKRLLGPLEEIMKRNTANYKGYKD